MKGQSIVNSVTCLFILLISETSIAQRTVTLEETTQWITDQVREKSFANFVEFEGCKFGYDHILGIPYSYQFGNSSMKESYPDIDTNVYVSPDTPIPNALNKLSAIINYQASDVYDAFSKSQPLRLDYIADAVVIDLSRVTSRSVRSIYDGKAFGAPGLDQSMIEIQAEKYPGLSAIAITGNGERDLYGYSFSDENNSLEDRLQLFNLETPLDPRFSYMEGSRASLANFLYALIWMPDSSKEDLDRVVVAFQHVISFCGSQ